ncbi:MAG: type II toxin-antitoxin system Phd/YefM family antitoxin [Armatimonadetes bacterium]|nr:type II toxin-antitoxin system Phd/YefM family antitoxin [Armatimonadota bacterium]
MERIISPMEARDKLGQIIEEAYYSGNQFIIARRGKPMAAIIPISEYQKWQKEKEEFFNLIGEVWEANKDADQEQAEKDVLEAVQEVRRKKR